MKRRGLGMVFQRGIPGGFSTTGGASGIVKRLVRRFAWML